MSSMYDPSAIFRYLPSIWKDSYEDKELLNALYESLIRIQDSDFTQLFQLDDAKDLSTAPVLTTYPVLYEKLEDWDVLETTHAHWYTVLPFASPVTYYAGLSTEYFVFDIPDHILEAPLQLFANGRAVPDFLYSILVSDKLDLSSPLPGTTVLLNKDLLDKYITGEPVGGAYLPISSTTGLAQGWVPSEDLTNLAVLTYRDVLPFKFTTDGTTTEYTLSLPDTLLSIDTDDVRVTLSKLDITTQVVVSPTYTSPSTKFVVTPKAPLSLGVGNSIRFELDTGVAITKKVANASTIDVTFGATSPGTSLAAAEIVLNFGILPESMSLTSSDLSLSESNRFHAGSSVRIEDASGTFAVDVPTPTSKVSFDRAVDVNTAKVFYLGVDLLKVTAGATSVDFDRPLHKNVSVIVEAAINAAHDHGHFFDIPTVAFDTITLPVTRPLAIDTGYASNENPWRPAHVYIDGLRLHMLSPSPEYSITDSVTIQLTETWLAGSVVDVFYTDAESPEEHKHVHKQLIVETDIGEQKTIQLDEEIDDNRYPVEIIVDAAIFGNPDDYIVVDDQFIQFDSTLPPGSVAIVHGAIPALKYEHVISDRVDTPNEYRGKLASAATLQDGITVPTITLTAGTDFRIVERDSDTYLLSSAKLTDAWFFNALVDEFMLSDVWGTPLGLSRDSSEKFKRVMSSLYVALRGPSFTDVLTNFGSVILGSDFLTQEGYARGISQENGVELLTVEPTDGTSPYTVTLIDGADRRISLPTVPMTSFHAVNKLLTVYDKDLSPVPWLAFMAEELSSDYRYAKRLDARGASTLISRPATYDLTTGILTDYSVDYTTEEVWTGDLVKFEFFKQDLTAIFSPSYSPASFTPAQQFVTVTKVIDAHRIEVFLDLDELFWEFGSTVFGGVPYGGQVWQSEIKSYTVWTRKTRPLDVFLHLDRALDQSQATIDSESVQTINKALTGVLSSFVFAGKIDWNTMVDANAVADLDLFIQRYKPAETYGLIYTEFGNDTGIVETVSGSMSEDSPLATVWGTRAADEYHAGQSYLGSGVLVNKTWDNDLLYDPTKYQVGVKVQAHTKGINTLAATGQFYLIARETDIQNEVWGNLYGSPFGLEDMLVKAQAVGDELEYIVSSGFDPRANGSTITIATEATVISTSTTDSPIVDVTFRGWVTVDASPSPAVSESYLFYAVDASSDSPRHAVYYEPTATTGVYTLSYRPSISASPISATDALTLGTRTFVSVTYDKSTEISIIYINASPTVTGVTGSPSLSGVIGYHLGLDAQITLDEVVVSDRVLSPAELTSWYGSGTGIWSSPMGLGAYGSPLAEPDTRLVYHFDLEDYDNALPAVFDNRIIDHSGRGNHGFVTRSSPSELVRFSPGAILTPLSSLFDVHEVSKEGYFVSSGVEIAVQAESWQDTIIANVGSSPLGVEVTDSPDVFVGDPVNSLGQTRVGEVIYSQPNIVFALQSKQAGWYQVRSNIKSLSSSFGTGDYSPYVGFTSGVFVGPDGNTYGQLTSPLTLVGKETTITFAAKHSGAMTSIVWDSTELLSITDKAAGFQQKFNFIGDSPFSSWEGGAAGESPLEDSSSLFISSSDDGRALATRSYTAYSSPRWVEGIELLCSANSLEKYLDIDHLSNPNIIKLGSAYDLYTNTQYQSFNWVFDLHAHPVLTRIFGYNVGINGIPSGVPYELTIPVGQKKLLANTDFKGGLILASNDLRYAVGVYHHDTKTIDHSIVSTVCIVSPASGSPYFELTSNEKNPPTIGMAKGSHTRERFLCVGDFPRVQAAFLQIYNVLEGEAPTNNCGNGIALSAALTTPLPISPGATFTVSVDVLNLCGDIDREYGGAITVTKLPLPSGTLSGTLTVSPVTGQASFTDLSLSPEGTFALRFTSGTLTPANLDVPVNDGIPVPFLSSISPSTIVAGSADFTMSYFGSDFISGAQVHYSDLAQIPIIDATLPTTFISPGHITALIPAPFVELPSVGIAITRVLNSATHQSTYLPITVSPAPVTDSPSQLVIESYPTSTRTGTVFNSVISVETVNGNIATGATGIVNLRVSPGVGYAGTISPASGTLVNGQTVITASFDHYGIFTLIAEHSPSPGGLVYSPDQGVTPITVVPEVASLNTISPGVFVSSHALPINFLFYDKAAAGTGLPQMRFVTNDTDALSPGFLNQYLVGSTFTAVRGPTPGALTGTSSLDFEQIVGQVYTITGVTAGAPSFHQIEVDLGAALSPTSVTTSTYTSSGNSLLTTKSTSQNFVIAGTQVSPSPMIVWDDARSVTPSSYSNTSISFTVSPWDYRDVRTFDVRAVKPFTTNSNTLTVASSPFSGGTPIVSEATELRFDINPSFILVGDTDIVRVSAYDEATGLIVHPGGSVTLSVSPILGNTEYVEPYSATLALTAGTAEFSPTISNYGFYTWKAVHSGVGSPLPTEYGSSVTLSNGNPTLVNIAPATTAPISSPLTISVFGDNFQSPYSFVYIDVGLTGNFEYILSPPNVTWVSENEMNFILSPPLLSSPLTLGVTVANYFGGIDGPETFSVINTPVGDSPVSLLLIQPDKSLETGSSYTVRVASVDAAGTALATAGIGAVRLYSSPGVSFSLGSFDQTVTSPQNPGIWTFDVSFTDVGPYTFFAEHSPASGSTYSPVVGSPFNVWTPKPTLSSISPSLYGSPDPQLAPVISVYGQNFYSPITIAGKDVGVHTGTYSGFLRFVTYVSPGEVTMQLVAGDLAASGSFPIVIKNDTGLNGGLSNPKNLVVSAGSFSFLEEEELSPTILMRVDPAWQTTGVKYQYKRVIGLPGTTHTSWQNISGNKPFRFVLENVALQYTDPTFLIPIGPGGKGAKEVIEIYAGDYPLLDIGSQNTAPSVKSRIAGTASQPFIIRAHKDSQGVADPVLINRGSEQSGAASAHLVKCDGGQNPPYTADHIHMFDLAFRGAGGATISFKGSSNSGPPYGSAGPGTNTAQGDYISRGVTYIRCSINGEFDQRTISVTPNKLLQGLDNNLMSFNNNAWRISGSQAMHGGLDGLALTPSGAVSPGNETLFERDFAVEDIVLPALHQEDQSFGLLGGTPIYLTSFKVGKTASLSFPLKVAGWQSATTNPSGYSPGVQGGTNSLLPIRINPQDFTTGYTTGYSVELTVIAQTVPDNGKAGTFPTGTGANVEEGYDQGGTILWRAIPQPGGQFKPTVGVFTEDNLPLSGMLVAGVAAYPYIRFNQAGSYTFEIRVKDQFGATVSFLNPYSNLATPTSLTSLKFAVMVTRPGATDPFYKLETPAVLPKLSRTLGESFTEPFTFPVCARSYKIDADQDQKGGNNIPINVHMDSDLTYTISSASFTAGWRWAEYDGTPLSSSPTIRGVLRCGSGYVYRDKGANAGAVPVRLYVPWLGTATGEHTLSVTVDVDSSTLQPAELQAANRSGLINSAITRTLTVSADNPAAPATTPFPYSGINPVDNLPHIKKQGPRHGAVFTRGWPGNPNHINYRPEFASLFPDFSSYAYLDNDTIYNGGFLSKWGMHHLQSWDLSWYGGGVHSIEEEHGMYLHSCHTLVLKNILMFNFGRTGIQHQNRRVENLPSAFPVSPGVNLYNDSSYFSNGQILIEDSYFANSGLNDGPSTLSLSEFGGAINLIGNTFEVGYDEGLWHLGVKPGGGLIVYDSGLFRKTGKVTWQPGSWWYVPYPPSHQHCEGAFGQGFGYNHFNCYYWDENFNRGVSQEKVSEFISSFLPLSGEWPSGCNFTWGSPHATIMWPLPYDLRVKFSAFPAIVGGIAQTNTNSVGVVPITHLTVGQGSTNWTDMTYPGHLSNNLVWEQPMNPIVDTSVWGSPPAGKKLVIADHTGTTQTFGGPSHGSGHTIGDTLLKDNVWKYNRWGAPWGSAATRPIGFPNYPLTYTASSANNGLGNRAMCAFGGIRLLTLENNDFYPGATADGTIQFTNSIGSQDFGQKYYPTWQFSGSHNRFHGLGAPGLGTALGQYDWYKIAPSFKPSATTGPDKSQHYLWQIMDMFGSPYGATVA